MQEIVDLTKSLIRFQTVHSKPDEVVHCADFICQYLSDSQIKFQRVSHQGIPSIVAGPDNGNPRILLMSHFDVVDGAEELFCPYEKNGNLYGRGSLDDKYAVALSLVLMKEYVLKYKKQGLDLNQIPFGILLTGDEEAGGFNGANKLLASVRPDFCITLDGGTINEIVTREKGIAQLKLISRGVSSHGARPWLGENAIESLIRDYQIINNYFTQSQPDNWHRTVNLAKIEAGQSYNQVPGYAEAILDIRYTEHDDIDALLESFRKSIKSEVVVLMKEPLFRAEPSPYLDMLISANPEVKTANEHGSSDARFLTMHGLNGIVWGADGNLSHHSENEHVVIDSVLSLYQKLDLFMRNSSEMN